MQNGISAYQRTQVETTNPVKLVLMLYERLEKELEQAKEKLRQGDMLGKGKSLLLCQDIVLALHDSLDLNVGEIAKNLQSLYLFMFREINEINLKKDEKRLGKLIDVVRTLRSGWEEAAAQNPDLVARFRAKAANQLETNLVG
jgi:flagellar protein FliS